MRIELQVNDGKRRARIVARSEVPREKLSAVARRLADSPLKEALERIGAQGKSTRSKT